MFATTNIPLILVIVGSTLLGGIIVGMFGIIRQYQLQKRIRILENPTTKHPEHLHTDTEAKKAEAEETLPLTIQE